MQSFIIIAAGTPPTKKLLNQEITTNSTIIAVDGGANCLKKYHIMPHYLVGDLDSIAANTLDFFTKLNLPIEQYSRNKDTTDTNLALQKAINLGATTITFFGCLGGKRTDHLLGSLGLLATCLDLKIPACLKDDYQIITLLDRSTTISGSYGNIFSLQTYGKPVKNLTINNSKYELNNYELKMGDVLTLSNEIRNQDVTIQFTSGRLLLIQDARTKKL